MRAALVLAVMVTLCAPAQASVHGLVTEVAVIHHVPIPLAHAIVQVESNYRCRAKNPKSSALGAMQVIRGTAAQLGVPYKKLRDCRTGLEAGMRYLRMALDRSEDDWELAATFFERGISSRPMCTAYGRRVMSVVSRGDT